MSTLTLIQSRFDEGYSAVVTSPSFVFVVSATGEGSSLGRPTHKQWYIIREAFEEAFSKKIDWRPISEAFPGAMLEHLEDVFFMLGHLDTIRGTHNPLARDQTGLSWRFVLPVFNYAGRLHLLRRSIRHYLLLINRSFESDASERQELKSLAIQVILSLKPCVPSSLSRCEILRAATKKGVPWRQVSPDLYQLGWGKNSRLIDSTHTDSTPVVSHSLAKNKRDTKRFLNNLGFPVAQGEAVSSLEAAKAVAQQLGYPVVLKPVAADGGESVFVGLADEADLTVTFEQIDRQHFPLLVERHADAVDYRLTVWGGQVQMIVERVPAHVVGDGKHTVEQLIGITNTARQNQRWEDVDLNEHVSAYPIVPDSETERWLGYQKLSLQSVPPLGTSIRLKGAASVSQGGTRRSVLSSEIHCDNVMLALDVVEALRLDIAGIDLLIPDISRSWREGGACICEVNSQPQLFQGFEQLVNHFIGDSGRIPITFVVSNGLSIVDQKSLANSLNSLQMTTALLTDDALFLDDRVVSCKDIDERLMVNRILLNREVEHLVWIIDEHQTQESFPVDRATLILIDDVEDRQISPVISSRLAWLHQKTCQTKTISKADLVETKKWQVMAAMIRKTYKLTA